jgi:Uma2 family endonuclease
MHRLGKVLVETGYHLASRPDTVRAPDVSFISTQRLPDGDLPEGFIPGAPDLAVEIVSPGDLDWEVQDKVQHYLARGAQRVWVIRPRAGSITVHQPDGTARTLRGEAVLTSDDAAFSVPGFRLALPDLFA